MKQTWTVILCLVASCFVLSTSIQACTFVAPQEKQEKQEKEEAKSSADDEQEADVEEEEKTIAEKYREVYQQYSKARSKFFAAMRKATAEERQELFKTAPDPKEYAAEMMAIAKEDPSDPGAFSALSFIATNVRSGDLYDQAIELLVEHHIDNKGLTRMVAGFGYAPKSKGTEELLQTVLDKSSDDSVKAYAAMALADYTKRNYPDKKDDIVSMYKNVIDNFGEVKVRNTTMGARAEAALFELTRLQIGMKAPNIVGNDVDGVEFELNDYLGKVVVVDFWGDW